MCVFFFMIRHPPVSTQGGAWAASEVYKRQAGRLSLRTDAQMRSFIASGFLALAAPELPASFHSELYAKASRAFGPESWHDLLTNVAVGITAELPELLPPPPVAGLPFVVRDCRVLSSPNVSPHARIIPPPVLSSGSDHNISCIGPSHGGS